LRVRARVRARRACRLTRAAMASSRLLAAAAKASCVRSAWSAAARFASRCACAALSDKPAPCPWLDIEPAAAAFSAADEGSSLEERREIEMRGRFSLASSSRRSSAEASRASILACLVRR
jgi:hypothetical protein